MTQTRFALLKSLKSLSVVLAVATMMGTAGAAEPGGRLYFEKNQGQADGRIAYLVRTPTMTTLLTEDGPDFVMHTSLGEANLIRMTFTSTETAWFEPLDPRPGRIGYFVGSDRRKWIRDVPTFGRVMLHNLYRGVDLVYYDSGGSVAYDLLVQPGADASQIRMTLEGHREVRIDSDGNLLVTIPDGVLRQSAPRVFAVSRDGEKRRIEGAWTNLEDGTIGFQVEGAHSSESVIIDPTLSYSTYLGGTGNDWFRDMAVSPAGELYLVGQTFSPDFPTTPGAFQSGNAGDVFVSKMDSSGEMIYGALVGGLGFEDPVGIAIDTAGNAIVAGTAGPDFPTTPGALDRDYGSGKPFVFKLNVSGSDLQYSTFLGGDGIVATVVAADASGNAYVAGITTSPATFPTTPGSFGSPGGEVFVTKLNPDGSALVYSGRYCDACVSGVRPKSIQVSATERVYLGGFTTGTVDFPTTPDALKGTVNTNSQLEGFLTEISPDGSTIAYSTYIGGGSHDYVTGLALDSGGGVHITGVTSSGDFPTTPSALKRSFVGSGADPTDFFYLRLNGQTHALEASTYLGGTGEEGEPDIAVNTSGRICLSGPTLSADFPVTQDALQPSNPGDISPVLVKLTENAGALLYSSYLGSDLADRNIRVAADDGNGIYVAGYTNSVNFPVTTGAFQVTSGGSDDTFLVRFEDQTEPPSVLSFSPDFGADVGAVTIRLIGSGLFSGTTFRLQRPGLSDIVAFSLRSSFLGGVLTGTVDLAGKAQGLYDIVVSRPDGQTVTLANAFTIEPLRPPVFRVEVVCPPVLRAGFPGLCVVEVENQGNVDAIWVPVSLVSRKGGIRLLKQFLQLPETDPSLTAEDWAEVPDSSELPDGSEQTTIGIPRIPPKQSIRVPFEVDSTGGDFLLEARVWQPLAKIENGVLIEAFAWSRCLRSVVSFLKAVVPGTECWAIVQDFTVTSSLKIMDAVLKAQGDPEKPMPLPSLYGQALYDALLKNAPLCIVGLTPGKWFTLLAKSAALLFGAAGIIEDCGDAILAMANRVLSIPTIGSHDPNDKAGPIGFGPERHIAADQPLTYLVQFENLASASAAAQEVVITDQLDPSLMDLSTFSMSFISFGDRFVPTPPGKPSFSTDVDLRPAQDLIARIQSDLDIATGLLTVRFQSIDPDTNQPTSDPFAGFLPPNTVPPQGQGSILFSVGQKPNLGEGTVIANQASIVFDRNAPILTPEWFNTIDTKKPSSQVDALPTVQGGTDFSVSWQGADSGAGVASFSVFVSDNGGPFTLWQSDTPDTMAVFPGVAGHTYSFYSIARDGVGNLEDPKNSAEAFTELRLNQTITFDPLSDKAMGDPPFAVNAAASSGLPVTFSATGSCTVAGNTVTLAGVGACTIMANQAGDASYNAAPEVARTFSIGKANQTIAFGDLADKVYGDAPFAVNATVSSGLPVTFAATGNCTIAGSTVTLTGTGSCTITAGQTGDANYNSAPEVGRTFSITGGLPIDSVGPATSDIAAKPSFVPIGTQTVVTAKVSDSSTGASDIASAEYKIDNEAFRAANPVDGSFNAVAEQVTVTIAAFAQAGVHDVCIRGRDTNNNVGPETCLLLAVYDTRAGFFTGAGWINSPSGAYAGRPSLTGKLNFGFASSYLKNHTVPTGLVAFELDRGKIKFRSTKLEWLVVAGGRAQLKGVATLNGKGSYQLLLTGIDSRILKTADKDALRIKITDSAGRLVYDNQPGMPDSGNNATVLDGGGVVIYK